MKKKLVMITGATSGFGLATTKLFNKNNYPLLLLGRNVKVLYELNLKNVVICKGDIRDSLYIQDSVKKAEKLYGDVDCLINNAGIMLLGFINEQNPEEWKEMIDVNILGVLNCIKAVMPKMIKNQAGTIMNMSSVAGLKTIPTHSVYCATKFAVTAITESIREQISKDNVRVIGIYPGAFETGLLSHTTNNEIKNEYTNWKESIGGVPGPEAVAIAMYNAYIMPSDVNMRQIVITPTKQER